MMDATKRLMRARELAAALAMAEASIWAWRRYGDLPAVQLGTSVRFSIDDVLRWVEGGGPKRANERRRQLLSARAAHPAGARHPGGRPRGTSSKPVRVAP